MDSGVISGILLVLQVFYKCRLISYHCVSVYFSVIIFNCFFNFFKCTSIINFVRLETSVKYAEFL